MPDVTTIKVPVALRDRIAARARADGTTLASVIERALAVADEEAFWARVAADHARERDAQPADRHGDSAQTTYDTGGLRDHLDPVDDAIGRDDW